MRRALTTAVAVAAALVAAAGGAAAHEEVNPPSVPTGRPVFLSYSAANEGQVPVTGATLTAPSGLSFGAASREPPGWTPERSATAITWSGGQVAPGRFEEWGVELEAPDQPGTFTFRSTLRFADGRTDTHSVVLTVVAAGTAPATPAPAPAPAPASATTQLPTTAPPTTAAGSVSTVAAGGSGDDDQATTRANLALGVGGGGVVLGLVALALAARRPRAGVGAPSRKEQDW